VNVPPSIHRTPAWQVTVGVVVPLLVAVFAAEVTLIIGDQLGFGTTPFVLVGWCVVLLAFAAWLNQVLFHRTWTFLPFLGAVVFVFSTWLWQRLTFSAFVPRTGLPYGYFLQPEGARARFWVLICPFWAGTMCVSLCFVAGLISGWRAGARSLLACTIPWWIAIYLVFALPSMYLDGQGNASIFI
jgi:hypothetical protein